MSDLERARQRFADEVAEAANLRNAGLRRGLATVRREDFVGPGPWQLLDPRNGGAYRETPDGDPVHLQAPVLVALDAARSLNNGDPVSLLSWLDLLELDTADRFLHVGCGVGYYTAIAAAALGVDGEAIGIEIDPLLAARAEENLRGIARASARPAQRGFDELGTFDAIFVNAGATHLAPEWIGALREDGRLLVPLTVAGTIDNIGVGRMLLARRAHSRWPARFVSPVAVFHCAGARDGSKEPALRRVLETGWERLRSLRFDAHAPGGDCVLHGDELCFSRSPAPH